MAALVAATHVFIAAKRKQVVDAGSKSGHDVERLK
jgi:hypothetical protein